MQPRPFQRRPRLRNRAPVEPDRADPLTPCPALDWFRSLREDAGRIPGDGTCTIAKHQNATGTDGKSTLWISLNSRAFPCPANHP